MTAPGVAAVPAGPVIGRGRALVLLATVFASGTAVMIVEMTAVRAVQPFFGSTNLVWTNVIAVVLAALAIGYALGGRLADRWPSPGLLFAVLTAGGGLLVAVALLVTPVSRLFLARGMDLEGAVSVLMRGSLGATLILFAPPILLLGTASPLAIRLLARGGVGRAAGRVFAVSTTGSILGTYLPALWLTPAVGSRGTILVAAAILVGAGALGFAAFRGVRGLAGSAAAALLVAFAASRGPLVPARGAPQMGPGESAEVRVEVESPYQYLTVRDEVWDDGSRVRVLTINEGLYTYHALRREGRALTGSRYYDDYAVLPLLVDLEPEAELRGSIVGLACGVNAGQWRHFFGDVHRLSVDGAEIDPEVIALGREHFGMEGPDSPWLRAFAMDGRQMLEALPEERRYHVMVIDAFANELYVPFHLGTVEFFRLCRRRLEPGGVLAMNVFATGEAPPNLLALENTLAAAFGSCVRARRYGGAGYVLLARNGEAPPEIGRLEPARVRERYRGWEGYEAWTRIPEWEGLLELGAAFLGESRVIEPREDRLLLTDDHAPLERLTDRFLGRMEDRLLAAGDDRAGALHDLLRRQGRLLAAAGAVWAALLGAALLAFRRTAPG